ncbi:hypothetical protein [Streptomyces coelicoflavus]|uniref:hypothetical protein n=1 Tax=Streptomyces coelicoflavus TaxID=285562 RepID=UPI002E258DDD
MGETVPGPAVLAVAGRVERAVVVRRLLAVDRGEGGLSSLHVRIAAGLAGVTERTVWRWLAEGREGRVEARPRQGGFTVGDALWEVLTQVGGNVAELRRRMLRAYDRALAELGFVDGANGPPVADGPDAEPSGTDGEERPGAVKAASRARVSGGVRLYAPGARLVSTRQVAAVVEAVGHTVAARGIGCVYGDTGLGKTVAVEQALHLLPGRVPVWRAVVGSGPGCRRCGPRCARRWGCRGGP